MNLADVKHLETPVTIGAVPAQNIGKIWKDIAPHLQRVVDHSHGDLTLAAVRNNILRGDCHLLLATRGEEILAAFTAEVRTMDSDKRVLMIPIVGGDEMDSWLDQLNEAVSQLARDWCCDEVRGVGRTGWIRSLKKYGWVNPMSIVTLEI
jgi:hypothetical protein